jgi:ABC-type glutathione transport system ATPase component
MSARQATLLARKPALMRVKALSKSYARRTSFMRPKIIVPALQSLDLEILPECVTALVGDSGCGKSTLARCLAGLERPDCGEIWFDGKEISQLKAREKRVFHPQIQLVFQDSAGSLNPRMSTAEIIAEPLRIQRLASGQELRSRAGAAMEEVGLPPDCADRSPLELSGGQRQRLAIARALVLQPKLLILDESLSGLDLITQAQILDLLLELQHQHALTYLMISHDLSLVGQVADFAAVMQDGRVVEQGTRRELFVNPRHPHTQQLLFCARALELAFRELEPADRP